MCRLVESLKILDGRLYNVEHHQERMLRSGKALFGVSKLWDLKEVIQIPGPYQKGLIKCRIIYSSQVHAIEFHPYQKKTFNSIKIIHDDSIDYSHKYEDRQRLNELYGLRGDCDDIMIIKNGLVTDGFTSNVAFYKNRKWYTPSTPLLKGTKRAHLLKIGQLIEREISEKDILIFEKISLINAMVDLGEMVVTTYKNLNMNS